MVAAGFHESIGRAATEAAIEAASEHGLSTVALTGGVFQNVRLSEVVEEGLASAGLEVLVHRVVPPNDAGISLGQAAIVAAAALALAEPGHRAAAHRPGGPAEPSLLGLLLRLGSVVASEASSTSWPSCIARHGVRKGQLTQSGPGVG